MLILFGKWNKRQHLAEQAESHYFWDKYSWKFQKVVFWWSQHIGDVTHVSHQRRIFSLNHWSFVWSQCHCYWWFQIDPTQSLFEVPVNHKIAGHIRYQRTIHYSAPGSYLVFYYLMITISRSIHLDCSLSRNTQTIVQFWETFVWFHSIHWWYKFINISYHEIKWLGTICLKCFQLTLRKFLSA